MRPIWVRAIFPQEACVCFEYHFIKAELFYVSQGGPMDGMMGQFQSGSRACHASSQHLRLVLVREPIVHDQIAIQKLA